MLDINNAKTTYINLLEVTRYENIKTNYKTHLKQLLNDIITQAEFIKRNRRNFQKNYAPITRKNVLLIHYIIIKYMKLQC